MGEDGGEVVAESDLEKVAHDFPDDAEMRISHEAIYQTLFVQGRGQLRALMYTSLRSGRAKRVSPAKRVPAQDRVACMVSISERPKEAEDGRSPASGKAI